MKKISILITFIFLLSFSGCISKLPTFTQSHPRTVNEWDANAYNDWLRD